MAFQGMNPEIERMMEEAKAKAAASSNAEAEARREAEVSDREMAAQYHGDLTATMSKKFAQKRAHDHKSRSEGMSGAEILRKGADLVGGMRKNPYAWKKGGGGNEAAGAGAGERKKGKFMKPKD